MKNYTYLIAIITGVLLMCSMNVHAALMETPAEQLFTAIKDREIGKVKTLLNSGVTGETTRPAASFDKKSAVWGYLSETYGALVRDTVTALQYADALTQTTVDRPGDYKEIYNLLSEQAPAYEEEKKEAVQLPYSKAGKAPKVAPPPAYKEDPLIRAIYTAKLDNVKKELDKNLKKFKKGKDVPRLSALAVEAFRLAVDKATAAPINAKSNEYKIAQLFQSYTDFFTPESLEPIIQMFLQSAERGASELAKANIVYDVLIQCNNGVSKKQIIFHRATAYLDAYEPDLDAAIKYKNLALVKEILAKYKNVMYFIAQPDFITKIWNLFFDALREGNLDEAAEFQSFIIYFVRDPLRVKTDFILSNVSNITQEFIRAVKEGSLKKVELIGDFILKLPTFKRETQYEYDTDLCDAAFQLALIEAAAQGKGNCDIMKYLCSKIAATKEKIQVTKELPIIVAALAKINNIDLRECCPALAAKASGVSKDNDNDAAFLNFVLLQQFILFQSRDRRGGTHIVSDVDMLIAREILIPLYEKLNPSRETIEKALGKTNSEAIKNALRNLLEQPPSYEEAVKAPSLPVPVKEEEKIYDPAAVKREQAAVVARLAREREEAERKKAEEEKKEAARRAQEDAAFVESVQDRLRELNKHPAEVKPEKVAPARVLVPA